MGIKYATGESFGGGAVRRVFFGVNVIESLLVYTGVICRSHRQSDREKAREEKWGKERKRLDWSSEVTEPLDDMRHANSFRRAENFGPRIQVARARVVRTPIAA